MIPGKTAEKQIARPRSVRSSCECLSVAEQAPLLRQGGAGGG